MRLDRDDLENINKRLSALAAKAASRGTVLTEDQLVIFERRKAENEAHGEIETEHPGYLGSQDTFYVGTIKGVGRIYQQTFVDTYSKMAFCKLYNMKTPITAADLLNDRVLPFFESQEVPMLRMLTDRGTEFCGKVEQHDYQLYLRLKTSITPGPRHDILKRTVSWSGSIRPFWRSFIKLHSERRSMVKSMKFKLILMNGFKIITSIGLIKVKCAMEEHLGKPS